MINRTKQTDSWQDGNQAKIRSGKGLRLRNGLPQLTTEYVTHTGQYGRIVHARIEEDKLRKDGSELVSVRIEFLNRHWIVLLRMTNPNLGTLCDAFGENETHWTDKHILIFKQEDEHNAQSWLRLEPAPVSKEQPKKGTIGSTK